MASRKPLLIFACIMLGAGSVQAEDAPTTKPAEKVALSPPESVYDRAFDDVYKRATDGWLEDPLRHIEGDMSKCATDLSALKTDQPVQKRQTVVVSRLDTIIQMLDKECKSGGAGSGGGKPLGRSVIAKGPGGQGDMHDPKAGDKKWASLPPKQREQILQSKTAGFPQGFESILQSYYERLAQEQVEAATATAASAEEKK